jgi:hypothetical protein
MHGTKVKIKSKSIKVHLYCKQIRNTITVTICKVFLTKLLDSYSLYLITFILSLFIEAFNIFDGTSVEL